MSYVAVAIGGSAVVGAYVQSRAADSAASAQRDAANSSNEVQMSIFNQQRKDNEPWREAGSRALNILENNNFMNGWQADPSYQFRFNEGMKAINSSAAAKGGLNSGATLKALTRYGQDYGSSEYNNIYNRNYQRLSALAGIGQAANAQNNTNATNFANQYSNNLMGAANAQSAGAIAQGNATAGLLNNGANTYMNYQMMNRMFPGKGA